MTDQSAPRELTDADRDEAARMKWLRSFGLSVTDAAYIASAMDLNVRKALAVADRPRAESASDVQPAQPAPRATDEAVATVKHDGKRAYALLYADWLPDGQCLPDGTKLYAAPRTMAADPCDAAFPELADLRNFASDESEMVAQPTNAEDAAAGNPNAIRHIAYAEGYRDGKAMASQPAALEQVKLILSHLAWPGDYTGRLTESELRTLARKLLDTDPFLVSPAAPVAQANETQVKVRELLALTDAKPLFGHPSGKKGGTHWITFMKGRA